MVLLVLAALGGGVVLLSSRRRRRVMARRGALLDGCSGLFSDRLVKVSPLGFPRMAGTADGLRWDVQLVPDALGVRKLPALWLMVSLPAPMPVAGTVHLMLRPTGGEGFSRFRDLPDQVALPAGYPADAALRTDDAGAMPDPALLLVVLALGHERVKEVIVSPKGLRVTLLADEADRKNYLIMRQTDLGQHPVDARLLREAMDRLLALRGALMDQTTRKIA
ncbi:hypothetical protein [Paragemmobacter aquarius]|nr:hypothetical protein [Gemmobacter aquarius]